MVFLTGKFGRMASSLLVLLAVVITNPSDAAQSPLPATEEPSLDRGGELLAADLSQHLIAINTSFSGAEMVLFGTIEKPSDIIVVVTGPDESMTIRRKEQVFGLWLNRTMMEFPALPSYYAVSATRPIYEIASPEVLGQNRIGIHTIPMIPKDLRAPEDLTDLKEALIREKRTAGLYPDTVERIYFIGSHLFRTTLQFPANLPTGNFTVSIYLFKDGQIIAAQTTPLQVTPVGISSFVQRSALDWPIFYGIACLLIAIMIGMASQYLLRKGF
ncbi:MAG: TIGR02186 family protein [Candidatus Pacebacteria bacterium]|nr:TIGR02186 family protein [Candidatus Paceibacterota bacterium]